MRGKTADLRVGFRSRLVNFRAAGARSGYTSGFSPGPENVGMREDRHVSDVINAFVSSSCRFHVYCSFQLSCHMLG